MLPGLSWDSLCGCSALWETFFSFHVEYALILWLVSDRLCDLSSLLGRRNTWGNPQLCVVAMVLGYRFTWDVSKCIVKLCEIISPWYVFTGTEQLTPVVRVSHWAKFDIQPTLIYTKYCYSKCRFCVGQAIINCVFFGDGSLYAGNFSCLSKEKSSIWLKLIEYAQNQSKTVVVFFFLSDLI